MISLRSFCREDASVLSRLGYAGASVTQAEALIDAWNQKEYNNRYFEMFAIHSDSETVGLISLYQHTDAVVSIGPEVFAPYQKRGYASEAMRLACDIAAEKGYKIVSQQIRCDNAASLALHRKLGFASDGTVYINPKGNRVSIYLKSLV